MKHLILQKIRNMMNIKEVLLQWSIDFLMKKLHTWATRNKFAGSGIKNENIYNNELAEELYKRIIRKSKKRKVRSHFIDNIWGADIVGMQLISKFNKGIGFLLCVIDIYSKYAKIIPLKDKKGITFAMFFQTVSFTIAQWNCG